MIYQLHKDHGKHMPGSTMEAELNIKNGWETVTKEEFYGQKEEGINLSHEALVELYEMKFLKKPHHKMLDKNIKAAIEAD